MRCFSPECIQTATNKVFVPNAIFLLCGMHALQAKEAKKLETTTAKD